MRVGKDCRWIAVGFLLVMGCVSALAATDEPSEVQLPYIFHDDSGTAWSVNANGAFSDGDSRVIADGGLLSINGKQYQSSMATGLLYGSQNEFRFPSFAIDNLDVQRVVQFNPKFESFRYSDIFRNSAGSPVTAQINIVYTASGQIVPPQPLNDGKARDLQVGATITTASGTSFALLGCGSGAAVKPRFVVNPENTAAISMVYDLKIPPHATIALTHFFFNITPNGKVKPDDFKSEKARRKLLIDLDPTIARDLVNFAMPARLGGELVFFPEDNQDSIELRNGDQYKGKIDITAFDLQTKLGDVSIPAANVVGMVDIGKITRDEMLVTRDGQMVAGRLSATAIKMEMSTGQSVEVPVAQIHRLAFRAPAVEPEELPFNPSIRLRDGQCLTISPILDDLKFLTPAGWIAIKPAMISSVNFQNPDRPGQLITLIDGSQLTGMLEITSLRLRTIHDAKSPVAIPIAQLTRLDLTPPAPIDPDAPALTLEGGSALIGSITGELKLDNAFDSITITADQIARFEPIPDSGGEVCVTLWDGSSVSGRPRTETITCTLTCGLSLSLPIEFINEYIQPAPQPSQSMIERITKLVAQLNAEDWRERESAQKQLESIGWLVTPVLKRLRHNVPPEAQQRVDAVLASFEKSRPRSSGPPPIIPVLTKE